MLGGLGDGEDLVGAVWEAGAGEVIEAEGVDEGDLAGLVEVEIFAIERRGGKGEGGGVDEEVIVGGDSGGGGDLVFVSVLESEEEV